MFFELAGAFCIDAFQPVHLHLSHLKNLIPVESEDIFLLYAVSTTAGTCQILLASPMGVH